ncbi:MAG: sigma 54-interacting transcriptional regulator, partial [Candidatus Brocadiaceae bacterium]
INPKARNKWEKEKECLAELEDLRTKHPNENEKELEKKLKNHLMNLHTEKKLLVKELFGRFPTIVLDELNSMSIESQGALLRFLENAEITPIGGCEDEMLAYGKEDKEYWKFLTDFLVVGVMNEDPEELTREEAIRFLKKESYIGGLLGDLLYEHIMKIRRLRSDLRARMMRNGKFEVPQLAKQRANIPVIFYNIINKDKKDYFEDSQIRITMDALEYLMKPDLEWTENIRLLQTLTKKVLEVLYEDYENKDKDLIIVREKHIRKAMKEIGMIKEEGQKESPI